MATQQQAQQLQQGILTDKAIEHLDHWAAKFPDYGKHSAIIPALKFIQEEAGGWLSDDLIKAVADYLDMPRIKAFEVATFYTMLNLKPTGRHKLAVCNNLPCKLADADRIVDHIKRKLNIQENEADDSGRFYLETVECMGACHGAPMMQVDDRDYHENLTVEKVDRLLDQIVSEEQTNGE